jgi:hypothetical protein
MLFHISQLYVCMYVCSGQGFPKHSDLYVVYCTSPVNFKSAAIPSRRDGTARPTYQRTAEPSPSGGTEYYVVDGKCLQFCSEAPYLSVTFFFIYVPLRSNFGTYCVIDFRCDITRDV